MRPDWLVLADSFQRSFVPDTASYLKGLSRQLQVFVLLEDQSNILHVADQSRCGDLQGLQACITLHVACEPVHPPISKRGWLCKSTGSARACSSLARVQRLAVGSGP